MGDLPFFEKKSWSFEHQPPWKSGLFFTSFTWICLCKWCFYFSFFQYEHFNTVLRPYCCHKNAHRRKMSHKSIQNDLAMVSRGKKNKGKNPQLFAVTMKYWQIFVLSEFSFMLLFQWTTHKQKNFVIRTHFCHSNCVPFKNFFWQNGITWHLWTISFCQLKAAAVVALFKPVLHLKSKWTNIKYFHWSR